MCLRLFILLVKKILYSLNGSLLYEHHSFGYSKANSKIKRIDKARASKNYIFNYPLGKFDYSHVLMPSMSPSGKYMVKTTNDFKFFQIRFNRNVDVEIVDIENLSKPKKVTVSLPRLEYKDEKYQIPWSQKDNAFFALKNNSLYKFYPDGNAKFILARKNLYDFNVSPSEQYALVFASDSLFLYNFVNDSKNFIYKVGKTMGINRRFVRGMSWLNDEQKCAFAESWRVYIYNIASKSFKTIKTAGKIFDLEWINGEELLIVTGDYPSDMSQLQTDQRFSILHHSLLTNTSSVLHRRHNHEPFSIKPSISPSKELILYSERKYNGHYEVKLMTLDGKYENVVGKGFLPFWGVSQ